MARLTEQQFRLKDGFAKTLVSSDELEAPATSGAISRRLTETSMLPQGKRSMNNSTLQRILKKKSATKRQITKFMACAMMRPGVKAKNVVEATLENAEDWATFMPELLVMEADRDAFIEKKKIEGGLASISPEKNLASGTNGYKNLAKVRDAKLHDYPMIRERLQISPSVLDRHSNKGPDLAESGLLIPMLNGVQKNRVRRIKTFTKQSENTINNPEVQDSIIGISRVLEDPRILASSSDSVYLPTDEVIKRSREIRKIRKSITDPIAAIEAEGMIFKTAVDVNVVTILVLGESKGVAQWEKDTTWDLEIELNIFLCVVKSGSDETMDEQKLVRSQWKATSDGAYTGKDPERFSTRLEEVGLEAAAKALSKGDVDLAFKEIYDNNGQIRSDVRKKIHGKK